MEMIRMSTEVSLSRIVQGMWRLKSWNMTTPQVVDFFNQCIELGVTSFDTAEIYGNYGVEEEMGKAFKLDPTLREKIQLVTKTGINMKSDLRPYKMSYYDTRYEKIIASCKESIAKMNCEYIDLYLIHREDPCIDHDEVARALHDLKHSGLIRAYGVSNFDPFKFEALQFATANQLVTNQIELNPVCFEHFNSGMMDVLQKHHVHPMIWSPLAGGELFTSVEPKIVKARKKIEEIALRHHTEMDTIVYAWLLYHPVNAIPISGSSNIERLKHAIDAFDIELTHEEWFEIYTASGQQELR